MRRFVAGLVVVLCLPVSAFAQLGMLGPWGTAASVLASSANKPKQPVINPKNVVAPVNQTPSMQIKKTTTLAGLWPFGKKSKAYTLTTVAPGAPSLNSNPFVDAAPKPIQH